MSAVGSATDGTGAVLTLRSTTATASAYGSISGSISADSFRLRRVRIVADIDARDVSGGASPWLRVDGPNGMLSLDNGGDQAIKGTGAGHREITLFVPSNATRLVFGLLVTGTGEATARGLRFEVRPTVAANTPLAAAAQRELDSALAIVRAGSLWRDTVTWSKVEPEVRAAAAGAESPVDVHPAIRLLLARLGDHHSFLMKPTGAQAFRAGGAENPRPVVRALSDAIGYVSVPAYSGAEPNAMRAYAKQMHDSLAAIVPVASCRWVLDLRTNGGGNMWPMLGGLRPFLGEVGLGSFVTAAGSAPLWHANAVDVPPPSSLAPLESAYVAVLTGPRTASSGEAVTISFRGRPRTRSFGLATAGLSTANQSFTLPDSSMIFLTVSVEADRTGRRYGEKIEPDEVIPAPAPGSADDAQLARAVAWLKSQPRCGG
jgi:carboxyl-terminal processing protease